MAKNTVITWTASHAVGIIASVHSVISLATVHQVLSVVSIHVIIPVPTRKTVSSLAAVKVVDTIATNECVVSPAPVQIVGACSTSQRVIALTTICIRVDISIVNKGVVPGMPLKDDFRDTLHSPESDRSCGAIQIRLERS